MTPRVTLFTRRGCCLCEEEVPVIAINGVKAFKYRVTEAEFLKKPAARA